jgi:hypothetical protein
VTWIDFIRSFKVLFRSAASKCCEYGLGLVSVDESGELQCFVSASFGNTRNFNMLNCREIMYKTGSLTRPIKLWTSGTRKGTMDKYRWCTSNTPINASHFTYNAYSISMAQNYLTTIYLQSTLQTTYFNQEDEYTPHGACLPFCEEQPL